MERTDREAKLPWIDISEDGEALAYEVIPEFDPQAILYEINATRSSIQPAGCPEHIADLRHAEQVKRYLHEISEFRHENRQPERQIAIEIIQKIKGIYRFYPKAEYLELAWDELQRKPGKHRIRWNTRLLGVISLNGDHYENQFFNFNYKFERYELKRLLDNQYYEMQRVLRETGN